MGDSKGERMAAMMRSLHQEMNGAVVEAMTSRGIVYPLSYGVAVPAIRQVAAQYAPDHELARLLYRQQVRELRLAGVYVADPEQVTVEELDFWARGVINSEVAEHLAYGLLGRTRWVETLLLHWLDGAESVILAVDGKEHGGLDTPRAEYVRYAALMAGVQTLSRGNASWDYARLERLLPGACAKSLSVEGPAWAAFLGRMIRRAPQGKERVRVFLENPLVQQAVLYPFLKEEVEWQFEDFD